MCMQSRRWWYIGLVWLALLTMPARGQDIQRFTPHDVDSVLAADSSVVLLDVRTWSEYAGELGHLARARLIPVAELESRIGELDSLRTIIVYCRAGRRSLTAAGILQRHGFRVRDIEGGILKWIDAGYPVVHEPVPANEGKKE